MSVPDVTGADLASVRSLRAAIDRCDRALVGAFADRLAFVRQLWVLKDAIGEPRRDEAREEVVIRNLVSECAARGVSSSTAAALADLLLDATKDELARLPGRSVEREHALGLETTTRFYCHGELQTARRRQDGRWTCDCCGADVTRVIAW